MYLLKRVFIASVICCCPGFLFAEADASVPQEELVKQQQIQSEQANKFFIKGEEALRLASADQFYGKAIEYYQQASALGHEMAQKRLEWLEGYLPNEPSLKSRYRRELIEAKKGIADAQYALGDMCEFGVGVEKDFKRALRWYKKAAAKNHGRAQNRLGELYALGLIQNEHALDEQQALDWIRSAAENNQSDAQFKLGNYYLDGRNLEKNEPMAFFWFKRAASLGHIQAQMQTAFMLKNGMGVKQNYEEALIWFEKAAVQGDEEAAEQVKEVNYILDEIFLKNFK